MHRLRHWLSASAPLWLVTLFSLPLLSPLWRWTAVPCTHDGGLHYHRVAAMRYAWERGLFFSRWLPDLALGYGYPFFVYREPLPLYAVLWPHLLGMPLPAASNLFYGLTILACGLFMFLWVRDILGRDAALVSAVVYMASPYVLVDSLVRGNAPESLALPLFPLLLWTGRRWMLSETAGGLPASGGKRVVPFLLTVAGLAFLSLSHNISSLIFVPTLSLYLLAVGWLHRLRLSRVVARLAIVVTLGLGVALFYTGGALLEMNQVTLERSTSSRNNDFHFNFTSLGEILSPVQVEDPLLLNPPLPFRLGWLPLTLALAGVAFAALHWRSASGDPGGDERRGHVVLMVLGAGGYLLMSLSLSRPLWEALPLIDFIQFPWRFVGRAALPVAFLAGLPFCPLAGRPSPAGPRLRWRIGFLLALILPLLEAMPALYPNICQEESYPTINKVHRYELETGMVGVDPEGSYFPRTVDRRPKTSPLLADYQEGRTPQRFDLTFLPVGSVVHELSYGPLSAQVHLIAPGAFVARYLSFAFPGWRVEIDGRPADIIPSDPEGLITFSVPAGEHVVVIGWHLTPGRAALGLISIVAMVMTAAAAFLLGRRSPPEEPSPGVAAANRPLLVETRFLLLAAVLLLAGKLLLIDRVDTPWRRAAPPRVERPLILNGGAMRLLGYKLSQTEVAGGGLFEIDMAWMAAEPPPIDYGTNVWLAGPQGRTWSYKDTQRPRLYEDVSRTRFWLPGQWAWDSREVTVLPGTPPGTYDIMLTLFDGQSLQPVTLSNEDGRTVGPAAVIGQVQVTLPSPPAALRPQQPLLVDLPQAGLRLLGYDLDRQEAAAGEYALLTLYWERVAEKPALPIVVSLADAQGRPAYEWSLGVPYPNFDWSDWPTGQSLRSQHWLRLPATLENGRYRFRLGDDADLGQLRVQAPDRLFRPPEWSNSLGAAFWRPGGELLAMLSGYTLEVNTGQISLELVWQAQAETAARYRVFVHLVDAQGAILAQSDAEPAGWSRPTSGWVPGEYVIDAHDVLLPAEISGGSLSLRVGLYDPDTGQRLVSEDDDFVTLPVP